MAAVTGAMTAAPMTAAPETGAPETAVVVGVDGGNSKTDVVLADTSGRVLAQVRGAGTRPDLEGVARTAEAVAGLVARARAEAGLTGPPDRPRPLAAGAFHWANLDLPHTEAEAHAELASQHLVERLSVRNDTFAVLKAGAPQGWGLAVVAGAGINACGVDRAGRVERFLALGQITGDFGGGTSLAVGGIGAAVRAGDGRGPPTVLRELIPPVFGLESVEAVAVAHLERRVSGRRLLDAAPVVAVAAQAGDAVASGLVLRMAEEVVTLCVALLRRLDLLGERVPVVLGGGTLQHGPPVLLDAIRAGLAERAAGAQARVLDVRPVAGPVLEALELAGAGEDAAARVRATLRVSRA
jgi:N-acetylglucosamine kinase-like BadF-type ATPase